MKQRLRILADWFCDPTWLATSADVVSAPVNPHELPIPSALADALEDWMNVFQSTFVDDDPASSGFADIELENTWNIRGRRLAEEVADIVRETHEVTYFDWIEQEDVTL
jgi:hypothetical protein